MNGVRFRRLQNATGGISLLMLAAALWLAAGGGAWSQTQLSPGEARQKLIERQRALERVRERQKRLSQDAERLRREAGEINAKLIEKARAVQEGEAELTSLEARLGELDAQRELINGSLVRQHKRIGKLLAALQRMGRNPPPVMATARSDALKMVRGAMMLASVFPELRDKAETLNSKLVELDRVLGEIRAASTRLRNQNRALLASQDEMERLMAVKKSRLSETQTALVEVRRAEQGYRRSVTDLNELIRRLDKTVKEKAGLGDYERELEAGTAPGQPDVELKPSGRKTAMPSPGRLKPAIPFKKAHGRLVFPAKGRRLASFGQTTRYGSKSKGITVETRSGAQITSPSDGWIVYAGPFRSYGQLLIINAGGGYHVLLAGMAKIDVVVGQFVLSGEPVGKMKVSKAKSRTKSNDIAPLLYIEFRRGGRPINPDPWWSDVVQSGLGKVQG